jgi:hypothetical protein
LNLFKKSKPIKSGKITFILSKDYANGAKTSYMTLKVYTFIGRLIRHIADKHFPMIRYAGLFSNRWKKQYLAQARAALSLPESYPFTGNNCFEIMI